MGQGNERLLCDLFMINDEKDKALMFRILNSMHYVFLELEKLEHRTMRTYLVVSPGQSYRYGSDRTVISDPCQVARLCRYRYIEFWYLAQFGHIEMVLINSISLEQALIFSYSFTCVSKLSIHVIGEGFGDKGEKPTALGWDSSESQKHAKGTFLD